MVSELLIAIADFLWGTPMTVILVGTGLYLSIRFRFYYNFRKIGFNWKNTYGRMFQKSEGTGTISGFAAACTAMANTIGVVELIRAGSTFRTNGGLVWPFFYTAVFYLVFVGVLTILFNWLEKKLNYFRV